jgi:glycosyltransferase involved in cell wall biosynthesis
MTPTEAPWAVMVLAHNEERRIAACLDSLFDGELGRGLEVFVMANGCTDRTEEVVREYARRRAGVHLVSIAMADKCNAWNVFVHETARSIAAGRDVYFFVDGDCRVVPGSLARLADALGANPHAHAASAPPASGRSLQKDRRAVRTGACWRTCMRCAAVSSGRFVIGKYVCRSDSKATMGCSAR